MVKQAVPEVVELRVQFNQKTGNTQVSGPIDNRMLCYAMLEMAKEIILKRGMGVEGEKRNLLIAQPMIRLQ